jgi:SAM-dependent methyltransferase
VASLNNIQQNWEGLAQADPLWAICTDRTKRGGRWQEDEFFATGDREIGRIMEYLQSRGLSPLSSSIALDFGCGVGRLTRALSHYFDQCWGVDISPTMIRLAKDFHGNNPRCSFWLNEVDDLGQFPDGRFGFIYSSITLQHIPKRYVRKYLGELIRVLQPGGMFVFQVPDRAPILQQMRSFLGRSRRLKQLFNGGGARALKMEMNCLPEGEVRELFSGPGVRIVDVKLTNSTDRSFSGNIQFVERSPVSGYVSKQYCVVKTA